ncbi:TetR/AcrR family transcriptional regulator [Rhodococcus sp. BP-252]|uniref:DNA-binding transcriptional regulator, AcrR family n=1 Tax=Rhodococcoides kyotonense TaxID=398843 RepID=A0A177Y6F1_9NOCA|nr:MULTISPECIES: TetR/AcrR family transcriptional regulator [Rhodococcus]MBY6410442.1 TetR/AcrR family transcriptional regulator [Rhodococcus sp. BP-320]MBY6416324.1 TetR/AcrR family transcriptional regulator [Rhodococcus sp. BP-321]MBY6420319.1 TetR/AcrR family transcriptional regulator [Rhodococcus sp. BP-324]MBY6424998.1 TetR/AcrR family transcriptional regulator [Rhodococcus sp. BP-323]MBY6430296.1 TetR/AcrR family transcriptional regulator [Rhodococcus sp. BP-322]
MSVTDRRTARPGGRSARVRADVHRAVTELIGEEVDALSIPLVAERAGVAATTVYRRWGDLDALRTEVAMEVLTADGPVPDTGDLHRDLAIWCEFLVTDIARPERTSFLRTVVGSTKDDTGKSHCLDKRELQIDTILGHARDRGEPAPTRDDVMDHVVAPLYFRILFGLGGTDVSYARSLVDRLFQHEARE